MIDVKRLRADLEATKAALARKKVPAEDVQRVADLDAAHRRDAARAEELRARIKTMSKAVGDAMRSGRADEAESLRAQSKDLGEELARAEKQAGELELALRDALLRLPNLPADDAPDGDGDEDNVVVRTVNYDAAGYGPHQRVPHWEVGSRLGILDLERGAKISGSMFPLFRGGGATLTRALCQLALDRNADAFTEVRPPTLVRTPVLEATGHLPKFADEAYYIDRDDLWGIPTAEVPLTYLRAGEIIPEKELPVRLMAYTPCYRREAGSAGRDTRGLLRVHEFDKVEILALGTREQAPALLDQLLARAIGSVEALGLAYRVLDICTGDLGQSHARSFDVEVYAPGCDMWLEVSSVSWYSDYQARRAGIRYRPVAGGGNQVCDTLNGSALAVPRVWAAVVETYHQPDGTVAVPPALLPYFRGETTIASKPSGAE